MYRSGRTVDAVTAPPPAPQQCARTGSKLPREVITWLQSLHLSGPVKHPRRDLSNGFRVGEVCARYWTDVPMHSLGSEVGLDRKRANWRVLSKLFARHAAPLSEAMMDGMIAAKDGEYAEVFLLQLYSLLTGRELRAPVAAAALELPPVTPPDGPYRPPNTIASHNGDTGASGGVSGGSGGGATGLDFFGVRSAMGAAEFEALAGRLGASLADGDDDDDGADGRQQHGIAGPSLEKRKSKGGPGGAGILPGLDPRGYGQPGTLPRPPAAQGGKTGAAVVTAGPDDGADGIDDDGRVRVSFGVSVRAAKQASTIVSGGRKHHPQQQQQQQQSGDGSVPVSAPASHAPSPTKAAGPSSSTAAAAVRGLSVDTGINPVVAEWIASVMAQASAASLRDGGDNDNEEDDDNDAAPAQRVRCYYLSLCASGGDDRDISGRQQQRRCAGAKRARTLWAVLSSRQQCERVAAHARADGTAFAQLVEILLRVPAELALATTTTPTVNSGSDDGATFSFGLPSEVFTVVASIVAALAPLDLYRAGVTLADGLLCHVPLLQLLVSLHATSEATGSTSEQSTPLAIPSGLASVVLSAAAGATPAAERDQISEALSALRDTLYNSGAFSVNEAAPFFLAVYGAVLERTRDGCGLPRRVGAGSSNGSDNSGGRPTSPPTPRPPAGSGGGIGSPLLDWLVDAGRDHADRALRSSSSQKLTESGVRTGLAGAWLSLALLQTANRLSSVRAATLMGALSGPLAACHWQQQQQQQGGDEAGGSGGGSAPLAAAFAVAWAAWLRARAVTLALRGPAATAAAAEASRGAADLLTAEVLKVCAGLDAANERQGPSQQQQRRGNGDAATDDDEDEKDDGDDVMAAGCIATAIELAGLLGDATDVHGDGAGGGGLAAVAPSSSYYASTAYFPLTPQAAARAADAVLATLTGGGARRQALLARVMSCPPRAHGGTVLCVVPVLGPLSAGPSFTRNGTACLALVEALARRYPPDSLSTGGGNSGIGGRRGDYPPTTAPAAAALRRRLTTAGSALVRDGCRVPPTVQLRLRWLFFLCRTGTTNINGSSSSGQRGGRGRATSRGVSRADSIMSGSVAPHEPRWRSAFASFYEDLTLLSAAAEVLLTRQQRREGGGGGGGGTGPAQGGATTTTTPPSAMDANQTALLSLAAMAQRVIFIWFRESGAYLLGISTGGGGRPGTGASTVTADDGTHSAALSFTNGGGGGAAGTDVPREGEEAAEQLAESVEWFQSVLVPAI